NSAEAAADINVTGTASISEAGNTVTVTINGQPYTGIVAVNGQWTVTIPAGALAGVTDGQYPVTVQLSDAAGNSTTITSNVQLAADPALAPTITLNAFAGDNILDGAEQQTAQTLSGTTTHVEAGQVVNITLNNVVYNATVQADGRWSVSIPSSALGALTNGTLQIDVAVLDKAGNPATGSESFTVDNTLSGLSVNPVTGDNQLNAQEAAAGVTISGTSVNVPVNGIVTIILNGKTYTATVGVGGGWSAQVSAADLATLSDGQHTITVSATDAVGQPVTGSDVLNVIIHNLPNATLDTPFGDSILNGAEAGVSQTLTGNTGVSGSGQTVTVTIGGQQITGTVASDGTFTVTVPPSLLGTLPQGSNNIVVTVTDPAGNNNTLTTPVSVDTVAPTLTVNPLEGDGYISVAEAATQMTLTGTASVSEAGRPVVVTINGVDYTGAIVQPDGSWSVNIPAGSLNNLNQDVVVTATLTDAAGNAITNTSTLHVASDPTVPPLITVNTFASDNIVDGAERQTAQTLSGTTTRVEAGQIVTITLNGHTYTATVGASGNWSVIVPAADMIVLGDGPQTITATVSDKAGNEAAPGTDTFNVDASQNGIAIDPVTGDNVINVTETNDGILITGTTLGVAPFALVTVTFGSLIRLALVQPDGKWSLALSSADLQSLGADPAGLPLSASVQALDGSTLNNSISVGLDNQAPVPTLNTPFGDGYLNITEAATAETLSGTTGKTGDGQTVTVTLGGHTYNATVDGAGVWSVSLPSADLQALPAGNNAIVVNVTDSAGNTATLSGSATVDFTAPTLTLNPVSGDGY
ncbi:Ig-like domain-containing protein, partial [Enterobacteriaceae bacterium ML5]